MLNSFCSNLAQNKNLLMLITTSIYILALLATFFNFLLFVSLFISILFLFILVKNLLPIKYIISWVLIFYLGIINTSFRLKTTDELLNIAPMNSEILGTVVSIPQGKLEGKQKFFFDIEKISFASEEKSLKNERVFVSINYNPQKFDEIKIYDTLSLTGRLSKPFKAGNPSQFDYGNYLRNYDTYAVFYAKSAKLIDKEKSFKAKVLQGINNYREKIIKIHSKYLKTPYLELLGGIVFGDDAVSPPENIKKSFVNSGLLHILAASGMNVAFIFGFFYWITSRLRINYNVRIVVGMLMVVLYTFMTGLGASILRASIMLLFVLLGKLIDRDSHSVSLLSFVALIMLIYNPMYINDVGFQLSFTVTFGILIMAPIVLRFKNRFLDYISGIVTIPVIAQLWVIPIQVFYFSNISIYSIFANIMSVPLLAVISFGGFVSSLISFIPPIADFVCRVFDFILNPFLHLLVNISDFWGYLPKATIQTTHPSLFQLLLYYLILLCVTSFFYKNFREKYLKQVLVFLSILFFLLTVTLIPVKNSALEIFAFDLGNADSFLIKTPKNEYILIDTGKIGYNGGKTQAEIILLKYFKDKGIKNVNSIIVTHFDNDHSGGVVDLLRKMNVEKLYVNNLQHSSKAAQLVYDEAMHRNVEMLCAENKQVVFEEGNLKLTNYIAQSLDGDNENSIITLLEYNDFSMLFTGDVGASGIKEVISLLPSNITVLKVPHHGAIDGLDVYTVKYLSPKISIVSVGDNRFGHPALFILNLLKDSKIYRTDIHNAILLKVYPKKLKILTYDLLRKKFVEDKIINQ